MCDEGRSGQTKLTNRGACGNIRRMRRRVTFAVMSLVALVLFSSLASARPDAGITWSGVWNSDFGPLTLDAGGSGSYTGFSPGTVSGSVKGNVDKGTWSQPGTPPKTGTFEFTMSSSGQSFTGTWAYTSGGCGTACGWNGTCLSGDCLKNGAVSATTTTPAKDATSLTVDYQNKQFDPTEATVVSGAKVTICDKDTVLTGVLFTPSEYTSLVQQIPSRNANTTYAMPSPQTGGLRPGQCGGFTVRNPTKSPIVISIFSEIHSGLKLQITVEPGANEPVARSFKSSYENTGFHPNGSTVASGATITVCDNGTVFSGVLFTHSTYTSMPREHKSGSPNATYSLPTAQKGGLKPGQCGTFIVNNPTTKPIVIPIFSDVRFGVKLQLTVEPAGT